MSSAIGSAFRRLDPPSAWARIVRVLRWQYFPRCDHPPAIVLRVIETFASVHAQIDSTCHGLDSDEVLGLCRNGLQALGFRVEAGKKKGEKIPVPVLFGENGSIDQAFEADAYSKEAGMVLEVEAGRAVANNQFLKDLFQASLMHDVRYLGIAVRQVYEGGNKHSRDYERVVTFMETLYASRRLQLPLTGILILGY